MGKRARSTRVTMSGPRHEWFQTGDNVVIAIMGVKKASKDDVEVELNGRNITATVKLQTGTEYNLDLDLWDNCTLIGFQVLTTKVEIKLLKGRVGVRWLALEGSDDQSTAPGQMMHQPKKTDANAGPPSYPSSNQVKKSWDKVENEAVEEIKKDKPEGEAALQNLFETLYKDASDETKRAMNKSFQESGGTVLSTNWDEIGSKRTEIQPPEGMVPKKYE